MKLTRSIFITVFLGTLAACAGMESDSQRSAQMHSAPDGQATDSVPSEAIVRHMHEHATQLARLNAALTAGDLEGAGTPAYWLSRHESLAGMPPDWVPYLARVRAEAAAIDGAADLDSAKAAARRLADGCRACHKAFGVNAEVTGR